MSLFDVIRYSNTDLDSEEELSKLPIELFRMYQSAAYAYYNNEDILNNAMKDPLSYQIQYLAIWSGTRKQLIFKKVLKEYNNEPI